VRDRTCWSADCQLLRARAGAGAAQSIWVQFTGCGPTAARLHAAHLAAERLILERDLGDGGDGHPKVGWSGQADGRGRHIHMHCFDALLRDFCRSPVMHHWVILAARWFSKLAEMDADRLAHQAWLADIDLLLQGCDGCWSL
jgi:hypothetical protein